jgi:predicted AlkP superfamily phosphohydrolase/phosphomutase
LTEPKAPQKVFSLGLDGATFDLMEPWARAGHLPNLRAFMEQGVWAALTSVILPFTPQAWGSFMCGVNPGKHGVFGFKQKLPGRYSFQLVNNSSLRTKTLWKLLSEQGKRVILVNIPMTYPVEEVNGILIGGMDSPGIESDFVYPPEFKKTLLQASPNYVIHLHVGAGYLDTDAKRREGLAGLLEMVAARERAILYLLDNHDWDFFALNFAAIDQVQHHFWRYMNDGGPFSEAVLTVYRRVDEAVGRIVERLGPDVLQLVMSDHGAGPASEWVVFIDEWLREHGLLQFRQRAHAAAGLRAAVDFGLGFLSRRLGSGAKDFLMRRFPGLRAKSQGFVRRSLIDWSQTMVYSGEHAATLRVNLKGRDPQGVVDGKDYERVRDEVIRLAGELLDPQTGRPLIERVLRREEVYSGPNIEEAPDLVMVPQDFAHQVRGGPFPRDGRYRAVVSPKAEGDFFVNGVHRLNGVFMARGPQVKKGQRLAPLSITDLFPTVLYALGLPVPEAVDGRAALQIFEEGFVANRVLRYVACDIDRHAPPGAVSYGSEAESQTIERALKGLGYLD